MKKSKQHKKYSQHRKPFPSNSDTSNSEDWNDRCTNYSEERNVRKMNSSMFRLVGYAEGVCFHYDLIFIRNFVPNEI